jgi:dTDP-L-rhamnose 4-epimerase
MEKKILILGGAGFIGSALTKRLSQEGHAVRVLDSLEIQIHGSDEKRKRTAEYLKSFADFQLGDIRSRSDVITALEGIEHVIHLAAETGTGQSMYQLGKYFDTNVQGTANLLECIANLPKSARPKSIIVASSRAIYGEGAYFCEEHGVVYPRSRSFNDLQKKLYSPRCPQCQAATSPIATAESAPPNCVSMYGLTKYTQEQMCLLQGAALDIPVLACRLQNVYGPGQSLNNPYTGIISIFTSRILNDNPILIFEDGHPERDFVFVDDVVDVFSLALKQGWFGCEVINVGTGKPSTVIEVARLLQKLLAKSTQVEINGEFRTGDIRSNFADSAKLKNMFGIEYLTPLEQGLERFVRWAINEEKPIDCFDNSIAELRERGLMRI